MHVVRCAHSLLEHDGLRIFSRYWICTGASPKKTRNIVIELQVHNCDIACYRRIRWQFTIRVLHRLPDIVCSMSIMTSIMLTKGKEESPCCERRDLASPLYTKWIEIHLKGRDPVVLGTISSLFLHTRVTLPFYRSCRKH